MTRRRTEDEAETQRVTRSADAQLRGTMFDPATSTYDEQAIVVERRDIRIDEPSQPGSASSERGAAAAKPKAEGQRMRILRVLAQLAPGRWLSRDEIVRRTGISINAACGRLTVLATVGHIEVKKDGAVSDLNNVVDGYRLTPAGRARVIDTRHAPTSASTERRTA